MQQPQNWQNISRNLGMIKIVKDLCRIEYGASPMQIRSDDNTGICIYGTGGFVGYSKEPLFKEPLIVVARKGTLDKPLLADLPCWVIDTAYAAIPKNDVDVKWLCYQFQMFDLSRLNESTGVPSISRSYLYKQPIPYQTLPEQRKIATILSTVDKVIENTEATIEKYKAIKAGMMQDLFNRGIDVKTGKLRPSFQEAPAQYKETELGWIPQDWVVNRLSQIAKIEYGSSPKNVTSSDFSNVNLYGSGGHIGYATEPLYTNPIVVVARKGTLNKPSLSLRECWVIDTAFAIIPEPHVCIHWLYYQLDFYDLIRLNESTGVPSISRDYLGKLMLKKPVRYQEQVMIANLIQDMDNMLSSEKHSKVIFESIKNGLMADLLTGKVRVKINEDKLENS